MHHTGWQYAAALSGTHYWYHRRRPAWSGSVLAIAYTAVASCVVGAPANPMQMRTIARLQHDSSTAGRSIMAVVQSTPRTQPSPQIHNELVSTGYLQTTHRCTAAPMRGTQPTHMCSPSAGPVARKLVVSMHGKQTQTCPRRVTATCTKLNAPQASVSSTPLIQPSPLPGEATPPPASRSRPRRRVMADPHAMVAMAATPQRTAQHPAARLQGRRLWGRVLWHRRCRRPRPTKNRPGRVAVAA